MFARAHNLHQEPLRLRVGEVLRAEVLAEALGLDPLENGEEEDVAQVRRRFVRELLEEDNRELEELEEEIERRNRPRNFKRCCRPDWDDPARKIGFWRMQNIVGSVGGNDDTIFNNMNDIGSLRASREVDPEDWHDARVIRRTRATS